jgi:hypothetical protein
MKKNTPLQIFLIVVLAMVTFLAIGLPDTLQCAEGQPQRHAPAGKRSPVAQSKSFFDSRYNHNHAYPMRGQSFRSLPKDYRVAIHGGNRYYFSKGTWYRFHGGRYIVVAPPVGLFVPFLPFDYVTIWVNGIPYYYANRVYYMQSAGGYVVVDPPRDVVTQLSPDEQADESDGIIGNRLFIYPREGQSEEQQAEDRYQCHRWAVKQTGFDPTQIPPSPPDENSIKLREDYQRAMAACLDSRGYTVK